MRRSHVATIICAFLVPYSILLCGGRSLLAERVAALEAEVAELRAQLEGNHSLRVFDADENELGIPWYGQGRVGPEEFILVQDLNLSWSLLAAQGRRTDDEI